MEILDTRKTDRGNAARYRYFIDMAGAGWHEYERWRTHQRWNDKRLLERLGQAVRGEDGFIKEISDGIVFPILCAMSRFLKQNKSGHWKMTDPKVFEDDDMLIAARRMLKQCDGRPMLIGHRERPTRA